MSRTGVKSASPPAEAEPPPHSKADAALAAAPSQRAGAGRRAARTPRVKASPAEDVAAAELKALEEPTAQLDAREGGGIDEVDGSDGADKAGRRRGKRAPRARASAAAGAAAGGRSKRMAKPANKAAAAEATSAERGGGTIAAARKLEPGVQDQDGSAAKRAARGSRKRPQGGANPAAAATPASDAPAARAGKKRAPTKGEVGRQEASTDGKRADEAGPKRGRKRVRGHSDTADETALPSADGATAAEEDVAMPARKRRAFPGTKQGKPEPDSEPQSPTFSARAATAAATVMSFRAPGKVNAAGQPAYKAPAGKNLAAGSREGDRKVGSAPARTAGRSAGKRSVVRSQTEADPEPPPKSARSGAKGAALSAKRGSQTPSQASMARLAAKAGSAEAAVGRAAPESKPRAVSRSAPQACSKRKRPASQQGDGGSSVAELADAAGVDDSQAKAAASGKHIGSRASEGKAAADAQGSKKRRPETGTRSSYSELVSWHCACFRDHSAFLFASAGAQRAVWPTSM